MAAPRKAKAKAPANSAPEEGKCKCGCGQAATKSYRQGHDAKHVSQLREAFERGELTRDQALAAVSHSAGLQAKLARSLELAAGRKTAREAADKEPHPAARQAA